MCPDLDEFEKKFNKELKTGLLSLLVLMAVNKSREPAYGYGIIKALEGASGGRFSFPEGTVYPILSSLSSKGLLKPYWGDALEGPRRKYYKLTPEGKKALKMCLVDWNTMSKVAEDTIGNLGGDEHEM